MIDIISSNLTKYLSNYRFPRFTTVTDQNAYTVIRITDGCDVEYFCHFTITVYRSLHCCLYYSLHLTRVSNNEIRYFQNQLSFSSKTHTNLIPYNLTVTAQIGVHQITSSPSQI